MSHNPNEITIPLTEKNKELFVNLLWLSYQKPVIKKANYFNMEDLSEGNICSDIQDFIYDYLHWGVSKEEHCRLTGKRREDWENGIKIAREKEKKRVNKS